MSVCIHRPEPAGSFVACRPCVCGQEYAETQTQEDE